VTKFRAYLTQFSRSDEGQTNDKETDVTTITEGSYIYSDIYSV